MSTIDTLFPDQEFTNSELVEIANAVNHPALKKYLRKIATNTVKGLIFSEPYNGESAESCLRRQARVAGGLEVIETLLNIEKPFQVVDSSSSSSSS